MSFKSNRAEVEKAVQEALARAGEIIGGMAESYAKEACPVDTGNLRNSITHQMEGGDTVVIGTAVEYAPYVELGTSRMRARPFLGQALENHTNEYKSVLDSELGRIS